MTQVNHNCDGCGVEIPYGKYAIRYKKEYYCHQCLICMQNDKRDLISMYPNTDFTGTIKELI